MAVHEFGHVVAAWLTGGTVASVVLHPLRISWTSLSENPHPQIVAWGGPGLGVAIPLLFCVLGKYLRLPLNFLVRFFAGFCVVANGLYLIVDSFGRDGDGGTLIRNGAPPWSLILFGLVAVPVGFRLWHGLGPDFGLGRAGGLVSSQALLVSIALLATIVLVELAFSPSGTR